MFPLPSLEVHLPITNRAQKEVQSVSCRVNRKVDYQVDREFDTS